MDGQYFVWGLEPVIIDFGPLQLRWYGLLFTSGFVMGYFLMTRIFRQEGKPESDLEALTLYMIAATAIGMRLGHCLFYQPDYYLQHPLEILYIWKGGYASHGAVPAILIALWLYSRRRLDTGQTFFWITDRICVVTALAGAMIRLANFSNSEIIGAPTTVPWAVVFRQVDSQPRHPSQLYEAAWYLISYFILMGVYRRYRQRTPEGLLFGLFLLLVFSFRFAIEFLKADQVAFEAGMVLNMGQLLSIPLILIGAYYFARGVRTLPNRVTTVL